MTVETLLNTQLSVSIVADKIKFLTYRNIIIGYGLIILIGYNASVYDCHDCHDRMGVMDVNALISRSLFLLCRYIAQLIHIFEIPII